MFNSLTWYLMSTFYLSSLLPIGSFNRFIVLQLQWRHFKQSSFLLHLIRLKIAILADWSLHTVPRLIHTRALTESDYVIVSLRMPSIGLARNWPVIEKYQSYVKWSSLYGNNLGWLCQYFNFFAMHVTPRHRTQKFWRTHPSYTI